MKVQRRSSPSLLLEASEPPTSVNVNGNYYQFELEPHHVERGKRGQKVFVCDLCPAANGIFKRSFSLKRHYLRFHINFAFLSPRDLNNCAIAVAGQQQRSGFPNSVANGRMINRQTSPSLIYRCHQCGCLLRTKNHLLKHLETHPKPPESGVKELVDGEQNVTNRCPRCSTAFSFRKTLMRHIKKNRCRGGNLAAPGTSEKNESETGAQSEKSSDPLDIFANREEEREEMDMEASLRLGCPTSLFRFACTLCSKMFNSYVNMCRHRRLAHGRYGICSPHWLLSRKLSEKTDPHPSVTSPAVTLPPNQPNSQDLSHFVHNANDNLNQFIDGRNEHINSIVPIAERFDVPGECVPPPDRWSWGESSYNVKELLKLDLPLQLAYYRGLERWKQQETAKTDESSSQSGPEEMDIALALDVRPCEASALACKVESDIQRPELSGEWTISKTYICSPCGQIFQDFLALLDHQQAVHSGVWCTHVQLNQSTESTGLIEELTRQIMRSGSGGSMHPVAAFECTKCHFAVQSIPELHSHILLCSNHVSASPYRKRRVKVNPSSRRSHWSQNEVSSSGNKGLQRSISSQTKNTSASRSLRGRSPKEDLDGENETPGSLRRSTRRVLSFNEPTPTKKKKTAVNMKRVLRQRVDPPQVNGSAVSKSVKVIKKVETLKKLKKPSPSEKSPDKGKMKSPVEVLVDLHECDGCQKKFQSRTSVLKHKYYCPNKESESTVAGPSRSPTPPPPTKPLTNGKAKNKTKSEIPGSSIVQSKQERSNLKIQQKSNVLSNSSKNKLKVPARSNEMHSTNSDAKKKKLKKVVTSIAPVLPHKSLSKTKIPSKKACLTKPIRKNSKIAPKKEDEEPEELTASGRPVRSSRKASMTLVMEDHVEASFLEALSPEQRIRVAEQKCPFCSKHYVYRSNFKKHLLEGCDTPDEEETSVNLTPTVKKPILEAKRIDMKKSTVQLNFESTTNTKEKREKSEATMKKVEKSTEKKVGLTGKEKTGQKTDKKTPIKTNAKMISKTPSPSKPLKKEEPKKSTQKKKKVAKVIEVSKKSNQKTKKAPVKKIKNGDVTQGRQEKTFGVAPKGIKDAEISNDICEKQTMEVDENSLMFDRNEEDVLTEKCKEPTYLSEPKEASAFITTVEGSMECNTEASLEATTFPNQEDKDCNKKIVSQPNENGQTRSVLEENGSKETIENDETTYCHPNESGVYKDRELGWNKVDEHNSSQTSNRNSLHDESTVENGSNGNKSLHALNKIELGEALDDAIRSGIFKPYSSLTKYPMRIRQLKAMAQAYCQSNASTTHNYISLSSELPEQNSISPQ